MGQEVGPLSDAGEQCAHLQDCPTHIPAAQYGGRVRRQKGSLGPGSGREAKCCLETGTPPRRNPWGHLEGHTFHRPSLPAPAKTQGLCDNSHPPTATLPAVRKARAVAGPVLCPAGMLAQTPLLVCALRLACCTAPPRGLTLGGRLSDISHREESVPFDGTTFWQEEILNCLANQALNRTSLSEGEQP